jgi:hypothetical protein
MVLREPTQRPFINEGAASVLALPPLFCLRKSDEKGFMGLKIAVLFFYDKLYVLLGDRGFLGFKCAKIEGSI